MPDVTVASTTDTQDQVNQAAGAVQTEEVEERPVPTGDVQVDSGQEAAPEPTAEKKEDKPVPRAVDKRIDKLTREKGELQRRVEELETKFQAQNAPPPPEAKKEEKVVETADKPTPDKYQTYEEYLEAMAEYKADQKIDARLRKMAEEEEKQQVEAAHKTIVDGYNEKVAEFKKDHEDFDDVVGSTDIALPQGVISTIVEMENGPAVAYYISAHPEEAKKIAGAPMLSAIAMIGKISAQLEKAAAPAAPAGKSPDRKPVVSGAPPPIKPLGGHGIRASVDLNDPELSYEDYKKARAAQEKQRRGY